MPPVNPYSAGGMVKDRAMFFGREKELKRIHDRLRKGDSTAVVGLRRIGKSSLLYQLAHQTGALPEGVVAVYLDLQEAAYHQPISLLNAAWQGLSQQLSRRDDSPPIENLADFSTRVKKMAADGFRPVLCLDEVEELTDRDAFDDDFFEGLRSLGNRRALAFVTASGESLDVLLKRTNRKLVLSVTILITVSKRRLALPPIYGQHIVRVRSLLLPNRGWAISCCSCILRNLLAQSLLGSLTSRSFLSSKVPHTQTGIAFC